MSTRYLDATRCALIADALENDLQLRGSEMTHDMRRIVGQIETLFRERSAPDSGVILTFPGEES